MRYAALAIAFALAGCSASTSDTETTEAVETAEEETKEVVEAAEEADEDQGFPVTAASTVCSELQRLPAPTSSVEVAERRNEFNVRSELIARSRGADVSEVRELAEEQCGDELFTVQEPEFVEPAPEDFLIELDITEQQCFGSAGCNVTVEPSVTYLGLEPYDPNTTYRLTFEVTGGEAPVIQTLEFTGAEITYRPVRVSTESENYELSATPTAIRD